MIICAPGEIAIVSFPFSDVALGKPRPAVALSSALVNEATGVTAFAMITSAARSRWMTDVSLEDLGAAGLKRPCFVRAKIFTVDNRLVSRRIGTLSRSDRAAVREMIGNWITV